MYTYYTYIYIYTIYCELFLSLERIEVSKMQRLQRLGREDHWHWNADDSAEQSHPAQIDDGEREQSRSCMEGGPRSKVHRVCSLGVDHLLCWKGSPESWNTTEMEDDESKATLKVMRPKYQSCDSLYART